MKGFGATPWQQTHWDWRAAANFICGGAGAGLIALAAWSPARDAELLLALVLGPGLVLAGLLCVWAEIGRPLRALNVFFNARSSWMTREALVATLLLPMTLAATAGGRITLALASLLALAFIYAQAQMLKAARGIPAWREPWIVPLILSTGLAEGAGLWLLIAPLQVANSASTTTLFAALLLLRALLWPIYRMRLQRSASAPARLALDAAGRWLLWLGSALPLSALLLGASRLLTPDFSLALLSAAGLAMLASGAWFKFTLIRRAALNQGFALAHLPVRGVRPEPPKETPC